MVALKSASHGSLFISRFCAQSSMKQHAYLAIQSELPSKYWSLNCMYNIRILKPLQNQCATNN